MGCSAGKPLSTSPEISSTTQHTNLPGANTKPENKNSLTNNGLVDEKRPSRTISSPKANVNMAFRKGSTGSTTSSNSLDATEKSLDLLSSNKQMTQTTPRKDQEQPKLTKEKENGAPAKKLIHTKNRSEDDQLSVKSIPVGNIKVQLTQSQADFFTMLDRKIEEGEDYRSDCER